MKRVGHLALVLVMATSFMAASLLTAAEGSGGAISHPNLLKNGDFESGNAEHWFVYPDPDNLHTVTHSVYDETNRYGFIISSPGLEPQYTTVGIDQMVSVHPDQPILLEADVFIDQMFNAIVSLKLVFYDNDYKEIEGEFPEYSIFRELDNSNIQVMLHPQLSAVTPSNARHVKAHIDLKARLTGGYGSFLVDNISLTEAWSPRLLHATSTTDSSIDLAWTAPVGETPSKYRIYQDELMIGETVSTATYYPVSGLSPASAYRFTVQAEAESGDLSAPVEVRLATAKTPGSTTIMPLGASMTYGKYHAGGYRGFLWKQLREAGFHVNMVGSQSGNPFGVIDGMEPDNDHEGHSGLTADQIADLVDSEVVVYKPDIVLVFAGTNDMFDAGQAATAGDDMRAIIKRITDALPETHVVVSSIAQINSDPDVYLPRIVAYNEQIRAIVAEYESAGRRIGFVDTYALMKDEHFPYVPGDPIEDGIHPTAEAFSIMGDIWYDAVHAIITGGHVSLKDPTRPGDLSQSFNADGSATLVWTASTDNIAVDHYDILDDSGQLLASTVETGYTTHTLVGDTAYTFKVVAVDKAANRSAESVIAFTTPPVEDTVPPSAPFDIEISALSHLAMTIGWGSLVEDDLAGYKIWIGDRVLDSAVSTVSVDELEPLTAYTITVAAIDRAGNLSADNPSIEAVTLPAPVRDLAIAGQTSSSVSLAWTPSPEERVTGYEITINDGGKVVTDTASFHHDGLTAGQTYRYEVAAIDDLGRRSLPSSQVAATIGKPSRPANLAAGEITDRSLSFSWDAVPSAVTYRITLQDGDKHMTVETAAAFYKAEDLKPSTTYRISVAAIDAAGVTSDLATIEATTVKENRQAPSTGGWGPPASLTDRAVYSGEEGSIKLLFAPNEQAAINELSGAAPSLIIDIPTERTFNRLELELSGQVLKLAADKQKPIIIRAGQWTMELPPLWLDAQKSDSVKLTVGPVGRAAEDAAARQALRAKSVLLDFQWRLNDIPVHAFAKTVKLTFNAADPSAPDRSGVFLYREESGSWTFVGGEFAGDGTVTVMLPHFSGNGVFQSVKTFADIAAHWAKADIETLAARQIVSGVTELRYEPAGLVSRAQFAAMLARALKLPAAGAPPPFTDVAENTWYSRDIGAAYEAGLISGLHDGSFAPGKPITREQMAVMIVNAYRHAAGGGMESLGDDAANHPFNDDDRISGWAKPYVRAASAIGLIHGVDGSFQPDRDADRAQAAAVINRLLKRLSTAE